ncbi:TRAF-type domain-containing protein [Entamoeba marina]
MFNQYPLFAYNLDDNTIPTDIIYVPKTLYKELVVKNPSDDLYVTLRGTSSAIIIPAVIVFLAHSSIVNQINDDKVTIRLAPLQEVQSVRFAAGNEICNKIGNYEKVLQSVLALSSTIFNGEIFEIYLPSKENELPLSCVAKIHVAEVKPNSCCFIKRGVNYDLDISNTFIDENNNEKEVKDVTPTINTIAKANSNTNSNQNVDKYVDERSFQMHTIQCKKMNQECFVCKEIVAVSQMDEHRKQHELIPCSLCDKEIERGLMKKHLTNECDKRLYICPSCHLYLPYSQKIGHTKVCSCIEKNYREFLKSKVDEQYGEFYQIDEDNSVGNTANRNELIKYPRFNYVVDDTIQLNDIVDNVNFEGNVDYDVIRDLNLDENVNYPLHNDYGMQDNAHEINYQLEERDKTPTTFNEYDYISRELRNFNQQRNNGHLPHFNGDEQRECPFCKEVFTKPEYLISHVDVVHQDITN